MPQLQVVDLSQPKEKSPLEVTLENFTKKHQENERAARESKALNSLYDKYQQGGKKIEEYTQGIIADPEIGPTAKVQAVNSAVALHKQNQDEALRIEKAKNAAAEKLKKDTEEANKKQNEYLSKYQRLKEYYPEEEAAKMAAIHGETAVNQLIKAKTPKPEKAGPADPFTTAIKKDAAKKYVKAQEDYVKVNDSIKNLEELKELGNEMSGSKVFKSLAGETAAKYTSIATSAIEPIIKIFNPVGAVPLGKLNFINQKFTPQSWELKSTQDGKIAALQLFAEQAKKRNEDYIRLMDKYKGDVPSEVFLNFVRDSEAMIDMMEDYQDEFVKNPPGYKSTNKKVAPKQEEKKPPEGTIRTEKNSGQKSIFKNGEWVKI